MRRRTITRQIAKMAKQEAQKAMQGDVADTHPPRSLVNLFTELVTEEKAAISRATEKENAVLKTIRKAAGTSAMFDDPHRYLAAAKIAETIARNRNEPLFNQNGEETLSTFLESYYIPLMEAGTIAIKDVQRAVNLWCYFSGDPPLKKITSPKLGQFKKWLGCLPGTIKGRPPSPQTVKNKLRLVQSVLDKAGPPNRYNRDAAGLLSDVPYVKLPKVPLPVPRAASQEQLSKCYAAATSMDVPKVDDMTPATWWRLLLALVFNTGIRRRTLFDLRMSDIDWDDTRFVIPPERMKSRRAHVIHANKTIMSHLIASRSDREYVLPQPTDITCFYKRFHVLQDLAGIPRDDHFTLHDIRRATATRLWQDNPQAAQLALGHLGSDVTIRHYVQSAGIVQRALDALPQPEAFDKPA